MNKDTVATGMRIFDANNVLVFENESDIAWKIDYNRLSKSWVIRSRDGEFVKTGRYRSEFWIDDSAVFEYYFQISADHDLAPASTVSKQFYTDIDKRIQKLENKLSRPKGLGHHFLCFISLILALLLTSGDLAVLSIPFAILAIFGYIKLVRYTKKHLWDNWLGSIALTLFLFTYYGGFLFICSIACLFMHSKWKKELAELKASY